MALKIQSGIKPRAKKTVLYGPEGIGKTSLAAQFPGALFIDTEHGTDLMDVQRLACPAEWTSLLHLVNEVAGEPDACQTLVLDTADWAEQMAIQSVCAVNHQKSIEAFGYGKGYTYVADEFKRLLTTFDRCILAGINVTVTAHAKMRKFEQPDESSAYDRWELKLSRNVAPLISEWADFLFFLNYKTSVIHNDTGKAKARGNERVIYTTHNACWDAKSRVALPEVLPLSWDSIAPLYDTRTPREELRDLMARDGVAEEDIRAVVAARGQFSGEVPVAQYPDEFISNWLLRHWAAVKESIEERNSNGLE